MFFAHVPWIQKEVKFTASICLIQYHLSVKQALQQCENGSGFDPTKESEVRILMSLLYSLRKGLSCCLESQVRIFLQTSNMAGVSRSTSKE